MVAKSTVVKSDKRREGLEIHAGLQLAYLISPSIYFI